MILINIIIKINLINLNKRINKDRDNLKEISKLVKI